jgi:uncharacterized protein YebE (UPF0316 family)
MDWNLFWLFVVLNIANVVIQTVRSIATIKCGKVMASLTNAVAYGLYTVVVVYTVCDLDLWLKVAVVAVANLVGVYVVKELEERARKDKLWLVKTTVKKENKQIIETFFNENNIPFTCYDVERYLVYDCFCSTQQETTQVVTICKGCGGKIFATENKLNL